MEMAQVKARARTALAMAASASSRKRRKISINNNFVQIKSLSNATVPATGERISGESPASCCSSNGSVDDENRIIKFSDLEVESTRVVTSTCDCGEQQQQIRREMSLTSELRITNSSSQEVDSAEEQITQTKSLPPQKMPTELELDEFFAAAEKDIRKRFSDKGVCFRRGLASGVDELDTWRRLVDSPVELASCCPRGGSRHSY
ncbi:hypothetical protein JHK87_012225 [Glycine soja]|nr:hypothetical protein JHK87_012225 [Glycine soja]